MLKTPAIQRRLHYATRPLALLVLAALLFAGQAAGSLAAVTLARFEATAQPDNTIKVEWETGSEINTVAFTLYRNETGSEGTWGDPVHTVTAGNAPTGQTYTYTDTDVQPGVKYYYRLDDISDKGVATRHGPVSAGIGLPANTATPTFTPTATRTATTTTGSGPTATQGAAPTATRQFTNTPPPAATATPRPGSTVVAPPPSTLATATPFGPAVITAPTRVGGGAVPPPQPTAVLPASPVPTTVPPTSIPTDTPTRLPPTAAVVAQVSPIAGPSKTPRIDTTPIIFEAVGTRPGVAVTALPGSTAAAAGRSLGSTLATAGAAIALAVLLGGIAFFVWRARQ